MPYHLHYHIKMDSSFYFALPLTFHVITSFSFSQFVMTFGLFKKNTSERNTKNTSKNVLPWKIPAYFVKR